MRISLPNSLTLVTASRVIKSGPITKSDRYGTVIDPQVIGSGLVPVMVIGSGSVNYHTRLELDQLTDLLPCNACWVSGLN